MVIYFHLVLTLFNCFLISAIKKTVTDFSTTLYPDFVCCCLPEFTATLCNFDQDPLLRKTKLNDARSYVA